MNVTSKRLKRQFVGYKIVPIGSSKSPFIYFVRCIRIVNLR